MILVPKSESCARCPTGGLSEDSGAGAVIRRSAWLQWLSGSVQVVLFGFVLWRLADAGLGDRRLVRSARDAGNTLLQFDSFSPPALATALLKQEAERLVTISISNSDERAELSAKLNSQVSRTQPEDSVRPAPAPSEVAEDAALQSLERLRQEVEDLQADLDRKLMLIYSRDHSWNKFLDCYLRFIQSQPQNTVVLTWSRCALDCSLLCHRTQEVVAGLQQIIRFHPELKTAPLLKDSLEHWQAVRPQTQPGAGLPVSGFPTPRAERGPPIDFGQAPADLEPRQ